MCVEGSLRIIESSKDNKRGYHCCIGKVITITYSDCVFVASVCQQAISMRHIVIRGLHGSTNYFHSIS